MQTKPQEFGRDTKPSALEFKPTSVIAVPELGRQTIPRFPSVGFFPLYSEADRAD